MRRRAHEIVVLRASPAAATGSSRSTSTLTDPLGLERVEQRLEEPSRVLIRPRIPVLALRLLDARSARDRGAALRVPPADRVRDPRGPRLRAGRAAAGRALAEHGPPRPPDGEGARRRAARRPRGRARPGSRRRRRTSGRIELRRRGSRRRSARARPRALEPPRRARRHGADIDAGARSDRRPRLGGRARRARRSRARRRRHVDRALRSPASPLCRAREIVVVTGRPERVVDALLELRRSGRAVSIVAVASETYAGRPRRSDDAALLRAAARGIPVAVVSAEHADRGGAGGAARRSRRCLAARTAADRGRAPGGRGRLRLGVARERRGGGAVRTPSSRSRCSRRCPAGLPRAARGRRVAMLVGVTAVVAGAHASRVRDVTDRGAQDIYAIAPPFDAARHPELYVLVVLAAAAFGLAIAVTAGSRPFVAAALTAAGSAGRRRSCLPATPSRWAPSPLVALWPVVVVGGERPPRTSRPARRCWPASSSSPSSSWGSGAPVGRRARLEELGSLRRSRASQRTVALSGGRTTAASSSRGEKTTVLRITAPRRALYWRATTLDVFAADRWVESALHDGRLRRQPTLAPRPAAARCRGGHGPAG